MKARIVLAIVLAASASGAPLSSMAGDPLPEAEGQHTNRLIDSNNPYLLLHADNPVDWYPWGPEAIARARAEDKPIFLSIGYSTCYWCHVAERTLYSDPDIAAVMNKWFINVKVDREQRPEIDEIYMLARNVITGSGGWPNNVFLTADLKPFHAGSYYPPEPDQYGRPGFTEVLAALHRAWQSNRGEVLGMAGRVYAAMQAARERMSAGEPVALEPRDWLAQARRRFLQQFDSEYGGLRAGRSTTKFPQTPLLGLLLIDYRLTAEPKVRQALVKTLDAMAYGGIHDHIGGGFHRYSTDRDWSVPHFEKMLYDNAQLLQLYAEAFETTDEVLYRYTAEDIARYLTADMMAAEGGFYTAQDAQIGGVEGASYRWKRSEIEDILGGRSEEFFRVYELKRVPEIPGATGREGGDIGGVVRVRLPIEETLARFGYATPAGMLAALQPLRQQLLAARNRRPQPLRDEKLNVDLNALAIEAFVTSGEVLDDPRHLRFAKRAAERLWERAYDPKTGRLMHQMFRGRVQTKGFLADYALFGRSLMALFRATGEAVWRHRAAALADRIIERFMADDGALAMTSETEHLLISLDPGGDDAYPSGVSAAIDLFLRMSEANDGDRYALAAGRILREYSARVDGLPINWPTAIAALVANDVESVTAAGPAVVEPQRPQVNHAYSTPKTADYIRVSAEVRRKQSGDTIAVTLAIDDGFHINANPASLDYLIPTQLLFPGMTPERIQYPEPAIFEPSFADQPLDVYEGTPVVLAEFPKGAFDNRATINGIVRAQACNERVCLPPSDLPVTVRVSRAASGSTQPGVVELTD